MTPEAQRLARLRGGLDAIEVGARGIESLARNASCTRLRAIVIAGLTPTEIVRRVYGLVPDAMSPFAMIVSQRYVARILDNAGASLLTAYREKGVLTQSEAKIADVADQGTGDSPLARHRREQETLRLLRLKAAGDPAAANLILHPRLLVTIVGVTHAIEFDYLVAADADPFYRVGTIKSYADRGGKTDQTDIRAALREASVGTLAMRQFLDQAGADPQRAADRVDLVLRAPGSFVPRLIPAMRAESELASLVRALSVAPAELDEIEQLIPANASLAQQRVIDQLPNHYCSNCKEHCALWQHCRAQAQARGLPVLLGDEAAERFAAVGSITRALDLLNGRGRPPDNAAEAALASELRRADEVLDRIANG